MRRQNRVSLRQSLQIQVQDLVVEAKNLYASRVMVWSLRCLIINVRHVAPWAIVAILFGSIPSALLANHVAKAVVRVPRADGANHRWNQTICEFGVTKENVQATDRTAWWLFNAWQPCTHILCSHFGLLFFCESWRGLDILCSSRFFFLTMALRDLIHYGAIMLVKVLFGEALVPGLSGDILVTVCNKLCYVEWLITTALVVTTIFPEGGGCATAKWGFLLILGVAAMMFVTAQVLSTYLGAGRNETLRIAMVVLNSVILGPVLTTWCKFVAKRVPHTTINLQVVAVSAVVSTVSATGYFMQSSSADWGNLLQVNAVCTLAHVYSMTAYLQGMSDFQMGMRILKGGKDWMMSSRCCRRFSHVETTPVVVIGAATSSDGDGLPVVSQLTTDTEISVTLDQDAEVYKEIAKTTMGLSMLQVAMVGAFFLACTINLDTVGGPVMRWETTLMRFLVIVGFNVLGVYVYMLIVGLLKPELMDDDSLLEGRSSVRINICFALQLAMTLNWITSCVSLYCPHPKEAAGGELQSLGLCA